MNQVHTMSEFNEINQANWNGHVFARTLPSKFDPNYDQSNKPIQRRITLPSSTFSPPTSFRLPCARPYKLFEAETSEQSFKDRISDLTIYLYDGTGESKVVQLFRNADERLESTLRRIQISIAKKIGPKLKKNKGGSNAVEDLPSIWKLKSTPAEPDIELDISDYSCGELLKQASMHRLFMQVPVLGFEKPLRLLIESNPPTITSVKCFDNLQANLFVNVPVHVQVECLFATGSVVDWYADDELVQTNNHLYVPSENNIGKELTVIIRPYRTDEHDGQGCQESYRFKNKVEPFPANALLDLRPEWTKPRSSTDTNLRVLTYNILADQNCTPTWHPYCKPELLLKQRRFPLIVHEILSYNADIICLQEVDDHIFERLLQPLLSVYGYKGHYSCKKTDGQTEGCGLFINSKRFELIECEAHDLKMSLPLKKPERDSWESSHNIHKLLKQRPDVEEIISNRLGHILQLATLQDKLTGAHVLVGNTHLFFHPDANHIRIMQMWSILRLLTEAQKKLSSTTPHIILCGDFNSTLENSCGKLLVDGVVPENFGTLKNDLNAFRWGERGCRFETTTNDDDFPEISVQGHVNKMVSAINPAPIFTHVVPGFKANLDHVVISNGLTSVKHAEMPTEDVVPFMPNDNVPSDHVSLLCDLKVMV